MLWGPALNTVYAVALKLPNMVVKIFVEPTWTLTPTFTDLAGKNDIEKIRAMYCAFSKIMAIITFPLLFTLIFLSPLIIELWVGPELSMAGRLMPLYVVTLFSSIPAAVGGCVLNAYARIKLPSFLTFLMALLNIGLCFVLGVFLDQKLFGIALASLICTFVLSLAFFPKYTCNLIGVSVRDYYFDSLLKPLALSGLLIGGGYWIFKTLNPVSHRIPLLLLTLSALYLVYYAAAYLWLLGDYEKKHIQETVRLLTNMVSKPFVKNLTDADL